MQEESIVRLDAGIPKKKIRLPALFTGDFRRNEVEALSRAFD